MLKNILMALFNEMKVDLQRFSFYATGESVIKIWNNVKVN